jgi:hypothetical protein
MTAAQPSASLFPEVKYLLDSASEEQRRETMRKNGVSIE